MYRMCFGGDGQRRTERQAPPTGAFRLSNYVSIINTDLQRLRISNHVLIIDTCI